MEIQHFSHPDHPLKLVDSTKERRVRNCDCCDEVMSFPGYACEHEAFFGIIRCRFYLHKSCAELAEKISHPLHPHPLILIKGSNDGFICDGCRNVYSKGFSYNCSLCPFNLHPKCASKQDQEHQQQTFKEVTLKHFCHCHELNLCNLRESNKKHCWCCRKSITGSAYCCLGCDRFIHESCMEIPSEVQHPLHPHPLILHSGYADCDIICDGCRNLFSVNYMRYHCSWCGFNLDPECAFKQDQEHHQTIKQIPLCLFCHKHGLNFCNLREPYERDCCCCKERISGSAYYCLKCKFFIHESCKEIPMKVAHPFHPQHILLTEAIENDGFSHCKACGSTIRSVKICCNECFFDLHVSCANPNRRALKHNCHRHNMYYFVDDDTTGSFDCYKCHERCLNESFYRCVECGFNLHFKCIPIPSVVLNTQKHHHPLTLIDSVKIDNPLIQYLMDANDKVDHSMDYYCDVCETPGNPKRHAYCCKECIYIAHLECIISKDDTFLDITSKDDTFLDIPSKDDTSLQNMSDPLTDFFSFFSSSWFVSDSDEVDLAPAKVKPEF